MNKDTAEISNQPTATPDLEAELFSALADLVPAAFRDGVLDGAALLDALGLSNTPGHSFSFTWPGIEGARTEAKRPTSATLVPVPDKGVEADSPDVLIEGDNLQVLKLLLGGYRAAAKLIYIDPPYNTGETFVYNDDYSVAEDEYLRSSGQVDERGAAMTSAIETAGKKHAPWLSMMLPRLAVARHLLRRDGVLLVSIDNNEVHHLRMLLDGLFGAANFVDCITWQGGRKGDAKLTAGGQDYILVYARDLAHLKSKDTRWRERKTGLEDVYATVSRILAEVGDDYETGTKLLREWYKSLPEGNPSKQHSHYDHLDAEGAWTSDNSSSPNPRENLMYEYKGFAPPTNGWRYEPETMERLDKKGRLLYPSGKATRIRIKKYLQEQERWAPASVFYKDRSGASGALAALMGAEVFDNPKDVDVLARFISAITSDDDLIIDFFAGSGTTGHATWHQNAVDGGKRRWLLVQAPEPTEDKSTARKQGYETVFEVTHERLRRTAGVFGGVGFKVFKAQPSHLLGDPAVTTDSAADGEQYVQQVLEVAGRAPVRADAAPVDVAWEVAVKSAGVRLDTDPVRHELASGEVYEFALNDGSSRLFVASGAFSIEDADALKVARVDTLVLRGDLVDDSTTLTLAPRCRLVLMERVAREVSL